jgi:hypothetical protein
MPAALDPGQQNVQVGLFDLLALGAILGRDCPALYEAPGGYVVLQPGLGRP